MTYTAREEANRRLVLDVYEYVLKPLDSSRVDDFFAPGYIQHNPMAAVVDIFRIENGRIAEHWDAAQPVPEKAANSNGMF